MRSKTIITVSKMSKGSSRAGKANAKPNSKRRGDIGKLHDSSTLDTTAAAVGAQSAPKQQSSKDDAARKAACIPLNCSSASLLDEAAFVDTIFAIVKAYTTKLLTELHNKHHPPSPPMMSQCIDHACHHHQPNSAESCCYLCLICNAGPFCELHATKHATQQQNSVVAAGKHHHHHHIGKAAHHTVLLNLRTQTAVCFSCPPSSGSGHAHHLLRNSSAGKQHHILPNPRLSHAFQLFHEAVRLQDDYVNGYLKNISSVSTTLHTRYLRDLAAHPYYALHGIENLSNTCCLSVVLQALVKTPVFREYMLARMHHCNQADQRSPPSTKNSSEFCMDDFAQRDVYKCLTCALSKATIDMFALPVGDVFDPCSIVCSVKRILAARNWQWSSTEQHDPAEILDKLLETIEREAELACEASRISPMLSGRRAVVMRSNSGADEKSAVLISNAAEKNKRMKILTSQHSTTSTATSRTRHPSTLSTTSSSGGNSVEVIAAVAPMQRTPSPTSSSGRTLRSASGAASKTAAQPPVSTTVEASSSVSNSSPILTDNFIDVIFRGLILLMRRCPDCAEGDSVTVDKFTILYLSIGDGSKVNSEAKNVVCSSFASSRNSSSSSSIVSANQMTNSSSAEETPGTNTTASSNPNSTGGNTVAEDEDTNPLEPSSSTAVSTPAALEALPQSSTNNITLQQCIDGFVSEHVLDNVMCNICLAKQKLQKTRFALLPPILIFTLKRYSTQSRKKTSNHQAKSSHVADGAGEEKAKKSSKAAKKSAAKMENFIDDSQHSPPAAAAPAAAVSNGTFHKSQVIVEYPLELDMSPYCADRFIMPSTANDLSAEKEGEFVQNSLYELYAVVQHLGQELDKGHYVCWVKHISGKWFYFDDRNVLHSNLDFVLTREAYMLFYRRKRLVSDLEQLIQEMRLGSEAAAAAASNQQQNDRFEQAAALQNELLKDIFDIGEECAANAGAAGENSTAATEEADKIAAENLSNAE